MADNVKDIDAGKMYGGAFGQIGSTQANDYKKLNDQVTSFKGTTLKVNGTEVKVSQGLMYSVKDTLGTAGQADAEKDLKPATFTDSLKNVGTSALSGFQTGGNAAISGFNSIMPATADATLGNIQAIGQGAIDGVGAGVGAVTNTIKKYTAPLGKVMDAFGGLMKMFDDWIATTFIGQIFGIKGSEIICTMFCIIISFLDCKTRTKLYNIAQAVKSIEAALKQGVSLGIDLTTTYNGDIAGPNSIADATSKLFGTSKKTDTSPGGVPLASADKILDIMKTPRQPGRSDIPGKPQWSRASLQAPKEVKQIIETITKCIKMITKMRITIPVGINGDIWDLAQAVLYALQGIVLQMATELLNKICEPIEAAIKKMIPDNCVGNMAAIFFNKIIDTIRRFKQWLLNQIKDFFGASKGFSIKWKTFGLNINFLLELLQMLEGLSLVLGNFADLLIACGLIPCTNQPNTDVFAPETWRPTGDPAIQYPPNAPFKELMKAALGVGPGEIPNKPLDSKFADVLNQVNRQNMMDALKAGTDIPLTNIPASRLPAEEIPAKKPDQIDAIARSLAPIMKLPMENIIVTPQELKFIQPGFKDAPNKIARLIADGIVENNLGAGWTTYVSPDNKNIDVVYTFRRSCGD